MYGIMKLAGGSVRLGAAGLFVVALTGCALLAPFPEPTTVEERLAMFPTENLRVEKPVEIRWNENQIPYVIARTDGDAAYALGLVQAHLRLSQLAMGRRVAQGRMSQMFGPTFRGLDQTLRAIGMHRSAKESLEMMPPESREWLQRFVDGLNDYQASLEDAPFEFWLMNIEREKWTAADVLAIGRLGSIDFNWAHYATLLSKRNRDDWPEIWAQALEDGVESPVSFRSDSASSEHAGLSPEGRQFVGLLTGVKRAGSNSYVVSGERTESGAAMIASDPHLGFYLPNLWMIAGLKTPTQHVVGFMPTAVPVFAMGRNARVAWGGTNLYAASSDLVDVSALPEDAFTEEEHDIQVRFWFDSHGENRHTRYGPVITDVDFVRESFGLSDGEEFALSWVGHLPSDEVTTFLDVHRSSNFEEFRGAFDDFLLPAQNMMYADADGNIGHLIATQVPRRKEDLPSDLVISPAAHDRTWSNLVKSLELPYAYNPARGFLASANNKPYDGGVPVGFFFALPDRILRLNELLSGNGTIGIPDLQEIQLDVYSDRAHDIKERLVSRLERGNSFAPEGEAAEAWAAMKSWDGNYRPGSKGALAVEVFFNAIAPGLAEVTGREDELDDMVEAGAMRRLVDDAMAEVNDATLRALADTATQETVEVLAVHDTWGEIHRLRLNHPMAYVPVFGERFRFADLPGPGSSETLLKTAHIPTTRVHEAEYGSQARHISDLSDPDANYFVLAGGQDGWINSSTYLDQVDLWKKNKFVQMPLTEEKIKKQFPYVTRLMPGG
ncbi:MAG: penicillin acylase family protein [Alphaproteobacteria bacterium]